MEKLIEYLKREEIEYFENREIKPYTTLGIGGACRLIAVVKEGTHLPTLVRLLRENRYPFVLLGGGSNIVFPDDCPRLTVLINRTAGIEKYGEEVIKISSGVSNTDLLSWCGRNRIGGMEFLAGIPGTVGGAAAVNAGAFGRSMSDILREADILDEEGNTRRVGRDFFKFTYRNSIFKTGRKVILNLFLAFSPAENRQIKEKIASHLGYRGGHHPSYRQHTAGCFFQNPPVDRRRESAGKLIEEAGFKGLREGPLTVSEIHGNFIVNTGGASFEDIARLERRICREVLKKEGIRLRREVIYLTPDGQKY